MNKIKLVTVASLTILALALAATAYAASLTLFSPTYDYTTPTLTINANIENNEGGTSWNTIGISGSGTNWFCRLTTTASGYSGSATIDWQLQKSTDGGTTWTAVSGSSVSTTVTFTGSSGQNVYATATGIETANKNWASDFTGTAKYRVQVDLTY